MTLVFFIAAVVSLIGLGGCQTVTIPNGREEAQLAMAHRIQAEPPGDYYVGRRYFKKEFHFWGYVRRPGQPWSTAQLVVLNENQVLAPDREQLSIGADNDYEYKLRGSFSGDRVYELVSNRVLPEFVLEGYELVSTHPAPIFKSQLTRNADLALAIEQPL
ncbi:MAG: hypothetical protein ABI897_06150 [Spartobacteria bacterium]